MEARCASAKKVSGKKQRGGGVAPFADQQVVSTAGGAQVHDLEALVAPGERCEEFGARETLPRPGTEQQDGVAEAGEKLEVGRRQRVERRRGPARDDPVGEHDDVAGVTRRVDGDISFAVGSDQVLAVGAGGLELHKIAVHWAIK